MTISTRRCGSSQFLADVRFSNTAEDVLISVNPCETTARAPLDNADEDVRNQGKPEVQHASRHEEQQIMLGRARCLSRHQRQFAKADNRQKGCILG